MRGLRRQELRVRDIRVAADIGVHAHEIGRPQLLAVDVRLSIIPPSKDQLGETIDYNRIVEYAVELGGMRLSLIETFARRLGEACLATPGVLEADVTVEKPGALPNGLASSRVVLKRSGGKLGAPSGCG